MTMKKLLALLLALIMVLSFAACSNATPNGSENDDPDIENGDIIDDEDWEDWGDDEFVYAEHDPLPEGITANEVDMSKYPADFSEWTAKNVMDYFEEAVDFPKDCEDWVQNHAEYWAGMPIYEVSGIWNEIGDIYVLFTIFNPDSPDTTPEEVEAVKQAIRDDANHDYTTDEIFLGLQDHMIGHVAFSYGAYVLDDDLYYHIEAAYNQLVESMGLTPDF